MSTDMVNVDGAAPVGSPDAGAADLLALGVATLYEAGGKIGALPPAIGCQTPGLHFVGRAVPVFGPAGDNLWLHRAVYACGPGDVLIATFASDGPDAQRYEAGYWGEILSWAARVRKLAAVVIDGCVRDISRLPEIGLPVFARGVCIRGTDKDPVGVGSINEPIAIGDIRIEPGDCVVGDADGIVVIARERVDDVVRLARERERDEANIIKALQGGATTLDAFGLAP